MQVLLSLLTEFMRAENSQIDNSYRVSDEQYA